RRGSSRGTTRAPPRPSARRPRPPSRRASYASRPCGVNGDHRRAGRRRPGHRGDVWYTSRMRRTQLYLDEECARVLPAESRRRRTTVSALVREAVDRAYGGASGSDRAAIIDRLAGVWADHGDLADGDRYVRTLRTSRRPERWGGGRRGEVPARQRRPH